MPGTNYNEWEKRAQQLDKEAEDEDKRDEEASSAALGLQDGPQGPPTQQAREQRNEMSGHSQGRKNFIAEQQAKEVVLKHENSEEPIVLSADQVGGRALRLEGCSNISYVIPEGVSILKIFMDQCGSVQLRLGHTLITQYIEISHCSKIEVRADKPLATVQCDECTDDYIRIIFGEAEFIGSIVHQNSPALQVGLDGHEPSTIGVAGKLQFVSRLRSPGTSLRNNNELFVTEELRRGEKEFPINSISGPTPACRSGEPEAEKAPADEEIDARAEAKREEGNEVFRANDFLQAAVFYTEAINLKPDLYVAWANRAQCFLKTGQPEKALEDAVRCTEVAPDYAKGWFRRGMALHALERYPEAVPFFTKAEELDPKNKQIQDAIKFGQLMCRKQASGY